MRKLFRSRTDSKLSGLCGGIGQYFNIDPTIIRLVALIGAVCSFGTILLIYIAAAVLVPLEPNNSYPFYNSSDY